MTNLLISPLMLLKHALFSAVCPLPCYKANQPDLIDCCSKASVTISQTGDVGTEAPSGILQSVLSRLVSLAVQFWETDHLGKKPTEMINQVLQDLKYHDVLSPSQVQVNLQVVYMRRCSWR